MNSSDSDSDDEDDTRALVLLGGAAFFFTTVFFVLTCRTSSLVFSLPVFCSTLSARGSNPTGAASTRRMVCAASTNESALPLLGLVMTVLKSLAAVTNLFFGGPINICPECDKGFLCGVDAAVVRELPCVCEGTNTFEVCEGTLRGAGTDSAVFGGA